MPSVHDSTNHEIKWLGSSMFHWLVCLCVLSNMLIVGTGNNKYKIWLRIGRFLNTDIVMNII